MIDYLRSHHGNRPSINANERMELNFLRQEVAKLKKLVGEDATSGSDGAGHHSNGHESSKESDSSSENEEVNELPQQTKAPARRGPRSSVSAEVFGKWNKKGAF